MSSEKHVDEDNETVASSTEKNTDVDDSKSTDSDNDDTDSNASSEYEVEKILAKRKRRRGSGYEYYIKWVGYDESANEWIPATSLNCPERLQEFQREEERKRKRTQRERTTSHKRRNRNNNRSSRKKKRRVKVINDDDDDDDDEHEDENENQEEPDDKVELKSDESLDSPIASFGEILKPNSTTYGVEKGYKVQAILGINRTKGEELHYLVHYISPTVFEDNMELIPAHVAKKFCEDEIIQFYETRITWNDRQND
ncbi:unnamed protein product [Adineta steineri]|uniref:Chromo domain-containing protein n=1 Tax=Adineta steineri TaxID=433720 RepID=A0A815MLF8_9BILA|nr:unnamed protein product [Adineta steineri]CAF1422214.1 unnamed protein product [Adineta steineri]